jgi:hypothetical protein
VLLRGLGLTGERRLLDTEVGGLDQAYIGGHPVAGLQAHHVPGHQLLGIDPGPAPVPAHLRVEGEHLPDPLERLVGLALLHEADQRVDHDHAEDHARVDPMAEKRGDHHRHQQDVDQDVVEVLPDALEQALTRLLGEPVGSLGVEASSRLLHGEAAGRRAELIEHLVGGEGVRVQVHRSAHHEHRRRGRREAFLHGSPVVHSVSGPRTGPRALSASHL